MNFLLANSMGRSLFSLFFKNRIVMSVDKQGAHYIRILKYTDGGKAYVQIDKKRIGFLDNPAQREGEFRSNVSSEDLVRWYYL